MKVVPRKLKNFFYLYQLINKIKDKMNKIMIITTTFMMIVSVNAFKLPNMRTSKQMNVQETETKPYFMRAILGRREEIFNMLEPLSNNIAYKFKQENEDKCKYISTTELDIYVNIGLMKAVEQFTPTDEPSVFSVFATYCIYKELNSGVRIVLEIQSQEYINEWENKQKDVKETTLTQHNYIQETSGDLINENEIISLFTYLELWEYINQLSPILKRAFIRKYSEYEFHPKHMHNGIVVVKSC